MIVTLICVKEGSKLRVKILSEGYIQHANCQFPNGNVALIRKTSFAVRLLSTKSSTSQTTKSTFYNVLFDRYYKITNCRTFSTQYPDGLIKSILQHSIHQTALHVATIHDR